MIYQRIIHLRFKKEPFAFIWTGFKHNWLCNSFWFLWLIWTLPLKFCALRWGGAEQWWCILSPERCHQPRARSQRVQWELTTQKHAISLTVIARKWIKESKPSPPQWQRTLGEDTKYVLIGGPVKQLVEHILTRLRAISLESVLRKTPSSHLV